MSMLKSKIGKLIAYIFHSVTSIRYTIKLENVDLIQDGEGLLILPNHPALIDPIILTGVIGRYILFSPVISRYYSRLPLLASIFSYAGVEYIDNDGSHEQFQKNILSLKQKLLRGDNILLYPAGSLSSEGVESIVNKRMAYTMIQEGIHKKVIGVKSSGLWGSIWSKAITGSTPNIAGNLFLGLYYIIANGIFFLPKREVTISFYDITKDTYLWSLGDRRSFNRHLEHFYNQNITPAKYIPHYFYYDDTRRISSKKLGNPPSENDSDTAHVSDKDIDSYDVFVELKDIIGKIKQKDISHLEWNTHLIADLEMDSLDMMELKTWVQKRFPQASNPEIQSLKILEDVGRMAAGVSSAKLPRRGSSLIMYRGFLRAFDGYTIGILLDQERGNDFVHILASLGKNGIPIPCTQNEEDFNRVFQEIDSGRIITSKAHYHSIRSSWFAKYEHNIIFIEDIKSRKTLENLKLLLLGLMPPYGK